MITTINLANPCEVFDRLAQLDHEQEKRCLQIMNLKIEQRQSEDEWDELEKIALEYLERGGRVAVQVAAWDKESLTQINAVAYREHGLIRIRPITNTHRLEPLSQDKINNLLMATDDTIDDVEMDVIESALGCHESDSEFCDDVDND